MLSNQTKSSFQMLSTWALRLDITTLYQLMLQEKKNTRPIVGERIIIFATQ